MLTRSALDAAMCGVHIAKLQSGPGHGHTGPYPFLLISSTRGVKRIRFRRSFCLRRKCIAGGIWYLAKTLQP